MGIGRDFTSHPDSAPTSSSTPSFLSPLYVEIITTSSLLDSPLVQSFFSHLVASPLVTANLPSNSLSYSFSATQGGTLIDGDSAYQGLSPSPCLHLPGDLVARLPILLELLVSIFFPLPAAFVFVASCDLYPLFPYARHDWLTMITAQVMVHLPR